jgi:hypothetical protein
MKKINNKAQQHRSFRRFIKQLFSSVIKRQGRNDQKGREKVFKRLRDIQDSIDIIARQIARWAKFGE